MPHRSDEEALRAKLDERDRELAQAQRDLEAAEKLLTESEKEKERLRRGIVTPPRPGTGMGRGQGPRIALVALAFGVLVAGLVVAMLVTRSSAPMPAPAGPSYAVPASAAPVPPMPLRPAPPPPPPPAPPIVVHIAATATAVSGETPVRVGEACSLAATLTPGPALGLLDLVVECAGTRLYGLRDEVFGVSMTELDAFAWPGEAPGTLRYEVTLSDTGPRTGRPEAIVRSWTGEGAVYRTGLGAFRVDLDVDPASEAVPEPPGSAIRSVPGLPPFVVRHGHVVSAEPAGLSAGTTCRLALRPSPGMPATNTRAHVRCGASTVYGSGTTGFLPREGDTLRDDGTSDVDGDPAITIDLAAGTVSIRDTRGATREAIEIALDPPPTAPPAAP